MREGILFQFEKFNSAQTVVSNQKFGARLTHKWLQFYFTKVVVASMGKN